MDDDNVVEFTGGTTNDLEPSLVVDAARDKKFESVLVVGITENDGFYLASSTGDAATMIFILEYAKHQLLEAACGN